jgi:guanylate kinase
LAFETKFEQVILNDNLEKALKDAEVLVNQFIQK